MKTMAGIVLLAVLLPSAAAPAAAQPAGAGAELDRRVQAFLDRHRSQ